MHAMLDLSFSYLSQNQYEGENDSQKNAAGVVISPPSMHE